MHFYQKLVVVSHAAKFMPFQVVQLWDIFVASYHMFVVNVAFDHYIKYQQITTVVFFSNNFVVLLHIIGMVCLLLPF